MKVPKDCFIGVDKIASQEDLIKLAELFYEAIDELIMDGVGTTRFLDIRLELHKLIKGEE
jgi:hypothetical protein